MNEMQTRLDVLTGGVNALTAIVMCLIKTHPSADQLLPVFLAVKEAMTAEHLMSTYGEGVSLGFAEVCGQVETVINRSAGKS